MARSAHPTLFAIAAGATLAAGCHTLLDIDDVAFGDSRSAGGNGGSSAGGATAGTGGQPGGGTGGVGASGGAAGTGGSAGGGGQILGSWSTPQRVDELSDGSFDDDDPTFTADLLEIYINSNRLGNGDGDIFVSTRATTNDAWGALTPVTELNSSASESNMVVGPAGLAIWFSSERAGGMGSYDIYVSHRLDRADPWSDPVPVDELNTPLLDYACSLTGDALTMIANRRVNGRADLFVTTRSGLLEPWSAAVPITELNTTYDDWQAWISPDGLDIYFASDRVGGSEDIYTTSRPTTSAAFAPPTAISQLNTGQTDTDPWLSQDQRYMMFARGSGSRDIYESFR